MPKVYSRFNPPPPRKISGVANVTVHREFAEDADINNILSKVLKTHKWPQVAAQPLYADVSEVGDLQQCMHHIANAQSAFDDLPQAIKDRVGDPLGLLNFVADPKNQKEAEKLGLLSVAEAPAGAGVPDPSLDVTGTTDTKGGKGGEK